MFVPMNICKLLDGAKEVSSDYSMLMSRQHIAMVAMRFLSFFVFEQTRSQDVNKRDVEGLNQCNMFTNRVGIPGQRFFRVFLRKGQQSEFFQCSSPPAKVVVSQRF